MEFAPVVRGGEAWRIEVLTDGARTTWPDPSPPGREQSPRSARVAQAILMVLCAALVAFVALGVRHTLDVPWMPSTPPIGGAPLLLPIVG